jgi:hypothetical protein
MSKLSLLTIAAITALTLGGVAHADERYVRRQGYQQYHYAPRSYRGYDRPIYRRGYPGPSHGYYSYGSPHYGQRTVYYNFFGFPIVTY